MPRQPAPLVRELHVYTETTAASPPPPVSMATAGALVARHWIPVHACVSSKSMLFLLDWCKGQFLHKVVPEEHIQIMSSFVGHANMANQ